MSNTYAKIKKSVTNRKLDGTEYTNDMELSLTAFVGKPEILQLTVNIQSTENYQSGIGYITLTVEEIDKLVFALLERKHNLISATGYEQSQLIPEE
jgi:hypothetical protein